MTLCTSCAWALPDGASFCSACGRPQAATAFKPISPQTRAAALAFRDASHDFAAALGPTKLLLLGGGALALIGTMLPLASGSVSIAQLNVSIIHAGTTGLLAIGLALLLAGAPFLLRPSKTLALTGLAVSSIVLADLMVLFGLISIVSMIANATQTAFSNPFGGAAARTADVVVAGAGIYALILGFALLLAAYVRLFSE